MARAASGGAGHCNTSLGSVCKLGLEVNIPMVGKYSTMVGEVK